MKNKILCLALSTFFSIRAHAVTTVTVTCDGSGKTDVAACLTKAIASSQVVNFGVGMNYKISTGLQVPAGVTLNGNGSHLFMATAPATGYSLITINGSNSNVNHLWIDYQGTNRKMQLLSLTGSVNHVIIEDNYLTGTDSNALVFAGKDNNFVTISGNTIRNVSFGILVNVLFGKNIALSHYPHDFTIANNNIAAVSADAIEINSPVLNMSSGSFSPNVAANHFYIKNNSLQAAGSTTSAAGFCIGLAGVTDSQVTGNNLANCKWQGIHIEDFAARILVSNNILNNTLGSGNPGNDVDSSGVLVLNSAAIWIFNNSILNSAGMGIELSYNGTQFDSHCYVAGNTVYKSGYYGVFIGGAAGQAVDSTIGSLPSQNVASNTVSFSNSQKYIDSNGNISATKDANGNRVRPAVAATSIMADIWNSGHASGVTITSDNVVK